MRTHGPIDERHLHESVRRRVITSEQLEAIHAVATSMRADEGTQRPDLTAFDLAQSAFVLLLALVPAGFLLTFDLSCSPVDTLQLSVVGTGLAALVAWVLRRSGRSRHGASAAFAGVAIFVWPLALSLALLAFQHFDIPVRNNNVDYPSVLPAPYAAAWLFADLVTVAVAGTLVFRARAPLAAIVMVGAMWAAVFNGGELAEHVLPAHFGDATVGVVFTVFAAAQFALARRYERIQPAGTDPAFWLHLGAALALAIPLVAFVKIEPALGLVAVGVAAFVGAYGIRARRHGYLAVAALFVQVFPALGASHAFSGSMQLPAVVVALVVSGVANLALAVHARDLVAARAVTHPARMVPASVLA